MFFISDYTTMHGVEYIKLINHLLICWFSMLLVVAVVVVVVVVEDDYDLNNNNNNNNNNLVHFVGFHWQLYYNARCRTYKASHSVIYPCALKIF